MIKFIVHSDYTYYTGTIHPPVRDMSGGYWCVCVMCLVPYSQDAPDRPHVHFKTVTSLVEHLWSNVVGSSTQSAKQQKQNTDEEGGDKPLRY